MRLILLTLILAGLWSLASHLIGLVIQKLINRRK